MALLKAPSKQPKGTTLQVRLEEEVRYNLDRYAEFLDANPSYVVSEALKLLYRKDKEFQSWLAGQHTNNHETIVKGESIQLELKEDSMHRRLQFGMREIPASNRRHGSCLVADVRSNENCIADKNQRSPQPSASHDQPISGSIASLHAAPPHAATGENNYDGHLLTIREVAELLKVPVSWVYGRTRKRSVERLPGIRLGKYWRFQEEEIHAWVEAQRGGHHVP